MILKQFWGDAYLRTGSLWWVSRKGFSLNEGCSGWWAWFPNLTVIRNECGRKVWIYFSFKIPGGRFRWHNGK